MLAAWGVMISPGAPHDFVPQMAGRSPSEEQIHVGVEKERKALGFQRSLQLFVLQEDCGSVA